MGAAFSSCVLLASAVAAGCGTVLVEDDPPLEAPDATTDASAAPDTDAAARPDAQLVDAARSDDAGGCAPPLTADKVTVVATADTSFSTECNGTITYGAASFMHVGMQNGAGVGLLRFDLSPAVLQALGGRTILDGTLTLVANPSCSDCGSGLPTRAGTLSVHALRPAWEEGNTMVAGADRCRSAPGVGWGITNEPPGSTTPISGGGVDFDEPGDTVAVPENADEISVALSAGTITARGALAAKRIAFLVRMVSGGRMVIATREKGPADAARLEIRYCR